MHKNATKYNKIQSKWCKNKHGASKIIDTLETYQVARKSSWILLISLRRWRWLAVCFEEKRSVLWVFPSRGFYRRKGSVRRWTRWSHHMVARPGAGPRHPMVSLAPGPPPSHLRSSRSFGKNRRFGFCFVQFREYFLCNFSETQKQQKKGTDTMASC
jgi:hypothetical protein